MAGIRRFLVLLAAGWFALPFVARAAEPVVSAIAFQAASPYQLSYEELYGLVTLRVGNPLTPESVRDSIRRLNSKSVFREVTSYVRERDGKAEVLFFLRPIPLVASIEVTGQKALPSAQIIAAARIRRGGPLPEKSLADARGAVESFLARKGFTEGKADIEVSCSIANGSGRVRIVVQEGK
ncbi:MAG: hypothetical protein H6Q84_2545, partial [Deltaproteobacteria bacterium]|nr:hypothetical protein [Deltaproteobacteria bacterium]